MIHEIYKDNKRMLVSLYNWDSTENRQKLVRLIQDGITIKCFEPAICDYDVRIVKVQDENSITIEITDNTGVQETTMDTVSIKQLEELVFEGGY